MIACCEFYPRGVTRRHDPGQTRTFRKKSYRTFETALGGC